MTIYYKAFAADGRTLHGRESWPLPSADGPGEWMPTIEGPLVPCKNGYHVMRADQLCYWPGWSLYEVEIEGERIEQTDKVVCRHARLTRRVEAWTPTTLYLWLADVAERALPVYESRYPGDSRPRTAIETLRRFARREATLHELRAATDAAYAAAANAANAAATAAAAAIAAAIDAANAAAIAAAAAAAIAIAVAVAAANAAAIAAERVWQNQRMFEYIEGRAS